MTLAMAAIVAAVALTATAFAIPQQQAFAWGHHNHNHHGNTIKVDQQINQANFCSDSLCVNDANNDVDIHR